jgi:flavorubredoxin
MELCLFGNNLSDAKVTKILIVFYSRYGNTARIAEEIAYGAKIVRILRDLGHCSPAYKGVHGNYFINN